LAHLALVFFLDTDFAPGRSKKFPLPHLRGDFGPDRIRTSVSYRFLIVLSL